MLSISLLGVGAIVLASVILGAFTFLNSPKQRVNQSFAVICICLGAWASANYIADNYVEFSLLWSRVSFFSVTIALIAIAVFAINFPRRIFSYPLERILIGIGIIEALVVWLPGFIPGVEVQQGVGNVVPGPLYPTFLVYMAAYFVMAMGCIVWSARHNTGVNLARVRLMLVGFGAMIVLASITNLILPLILGNNGLAWLGAYFSLIFIGTTAYAIIRQRLFNIRLVVARSATYILLLGTLALIYGVAIFGISAFVFESSQVTAAERSINVAIAIVLAFTFQPLRRFFERLTDNIFFRDHYDSQQALNDIGQIVVAEFRLDRVPQDVDSDLRRSQGGQRPVLRF
jgi:hypothetical protein